MAEFITSHPSPHPQVSEEIQGEQTQKRQYHVPAVSEYGTLNSLTNSAKDRPGSDDVKMGMDVNNKS